MTMLTSSDPGPAVEFDDIQDVLTETGSDAAECHGMLCGMMCAVERMDAAAWAANVLAGRLELPVAPRESDMGEAPALTDRGASLVTLFQQTATQLEDPEYGFFPLLPDDDADLTLRADALARWCQGFLFGLSLGGAQQGAGLPEQAGEVIADLAEIARLGVEEGPGGEEDEVAYAEIFEYVRMAALVVYEELRDLRSARPDDKPLH